jgi:hypothetical protein
LRELIKNKRKSNTHLGSHFTYFVIQYSCVGAVKFILYVIKIANSVCLLDIVNFVLFIPCIFLHFVSQNVGCKEVYGMNNVTCTSTDVQQANAICNFNNTKNNFYSTNAAILYNKICKMGT